MQYRKMILNGMAMLFLLLFTISVYSEQMATTDDGKKIVLKDNGTWEFVVTPKTKKNASATAKTGGTVNNKNNKKEGTDFTSLVDELKSPTKGNFRSVRWGMTKVLVKKNEKLKLIKEKKNSLKYSYTLIGMKCAVQYYFTANKLTKARYSLKQQHHDPALFNRDYNAMKRYLAQIYGSPLSDENVWANEQFKDNKSKWGFAISIGFLKRIVKWKTTETNVVLKAEGVNHEIFINIEYEKL